MPHGWVVHYRVLELCLYPKGTGCVLLRGSTAAAAFNRSRTQERLRAAIGNRWMHGGWWWGDAGIARRWKGGCAVVARRLLWGLLWGLLGGWPADVPRMTGCRGVSTEMYRDRRVGRRGSGQPSYPLLVARFPLKGLALSLQSRASSPAPPSVGLCPPEIKGSSSTTLAPTIKSMRRR